MSWRNTILYLLFGGTLAAFLHREQERGTFERFDRAHREFLKANPGAVGGVLSSRGPSIVLARLDDVDQTNRVFEGWPLTGGDWEVVLQNLKDYGPRHTAIAAPLLVESPALGLKQAAEALPGGLTVPCAVSASAAGEVVLPDSLPVLTCSYPANRVPEFRALTPQSMPGLVGTGEIDLAPREGRLTVDGDWCRVPMLARYGNRLVPTVALRALLAWAEVKPEDVRVVPGVAIVAGRALRIPIDEGGFFRCYLSLTPEVPALNADTFVVPKAQAESLLREGSPERSVLGAVTGALVWMAHDDQASRRFRLPSGTPASAGELTARALAAIQSGRYMRPLEPVRQWGAEVLALLAGCWLVHWRRALVWPAVLVLLLGLLAASLAIHQSGQEWLALVPPAGILLAAAVLAVLLPRSGKRAASEGPATTTGRGSTIPLAPRDGAAGEAVAVADAGMADPGMENGPARDEVPSDVTVPEPEPIPDSTPPQEALAEPAPEPAAEAAVADRAPEPGARGRRRKRRR